MLYKSRTACASDQNKIYHLYKVVAERSGGIARETDEITHDYIAHNLQRALKDGISFVIEHPENPDTLVAEIHCCKPIPRIFRHVLSELTIVVHPDFQGSGIGKIIFTDLLKHIEAHRSDVLRVELFARESNTKAIAFYQHLGFVVEGRFEKRVAEQTGSIDADIPMAWFNRNFVKA